jgi:hypothetical protein
MNYIVSHPIEHKGKHVGGRRIINSSDWLDGSFDHFFDVYVFDGDINESRKRSSPVKRISIKKEEIT